MDNKWFLSITWLHMFIFYITSIRCWFWENHKILKSFLAASCILHHKNKSTWFHRSFWSWGSHQFRRYHHWTLHVNASKLFWTEESPNGQIGVVDLMFVTCQSLHDRMWCWRPNCDVGNRNCILVAFNIGANFRMKLVLIGIYVVWDTKNNESYFIRDVKTTSLWILIKIISKMD